MVNNLITCVVRNVVVVVDPVFFFLQTRNGEVNVYICWEGGGWMVLVFIARWEIQFIREHENLGCNMYKKFVCV